MPKLSDQFSVLAERTKKTEDTVDAACERDRTKLEAQRDKLKASIAGVLSQRRQTSRTPRPTPTPRWSRVASQSTSGHQVMRSRLVPVGIALVPIAVGIVWWIIHSATVNHRLAVHTGTVNEPGPYYGFWSGFWSDIAEFGIIGAIGTGVYQQVRKYNCHEPRCWRVGNHFAAGGQCLLCYRHHPDYHSTQPTHELVARLHREYQHRQEDRNIK